MSKQFKNKRCVYCAKPNSSEDGDHVVSRQFFLPETRAHLHLPKVPACKACNNAKSTLEHYLTAVMPFGGQHADARENLATMVPPRLAKNNKIFDALRQGMESILVSRNEEPWVPETTLPLDGERLIQLYEYMTKGLAHWHWGIYLPADICLVKAAFVTAHIRTQFERLLTMNAKQRVSETLGDGVFVYDGAQSAECPELTVWRMSLYGVVVGGDPRAPMETCSEAFVLTAPKRMPAAIELVRLLG